MFKTNVIYPLTLLLVLSLNGTSIFAQSVQDRPQSEGDAGRPAVTSGTGVGVVQQTGGAEAAVPLRKISLFSSGVAFFEHAGEVSGPQEIDLPFRVSAVNDALKSLIINDPGSASPSVQYPSEQTLYRTLRSLKIDLSGNPGTAQILEGLRGAELQINTPSPVSGRILGVEYRTAPGGGGYGAEPLLEPWISLVTHQGIRMIALKDMASFSFTDPLINGDLQRALDLIMASREAETRVLRVVLPGQDARTVSLSYVIPSPVWKASYRLDLNGDAPLIQGWAIVDNDGDTDWTNVELSLVTGRQVSFIQDLYAPYYLFRPTLPLAIAGIAEARTYDSGWGGMGESMTAADGVREAPQAKMLQRNAPAPAPMAPAAAYGVLAGGTLETARGQAAGDQFEFTLKEPVTLERQQSAMFPLVEGTIGAEKILVFNGAKASQGGGIHPAIGAELTNTTGMKLPAGPVSVFDGGTYAGDALLDFFPQDEKRLISYGEDLSVSGSLITSSSPELRTVRISGGVMTLSRRISYEKTYTFNNASGERKKLILEHPLTPGTDLVMPASYDERTDSLYRFSMNLPAERELTITVREERPQDERIILTQIRAETFAGYASNQELPPAVREALQRAITLKKAADAAIRVQQETEEQRTRLISEQDRIRRNLEAVGNRELGQEYLKRLTDMDGEIDGMNAQTEEARKNAKAAQKDYEDYLGGLSI